MKIVLKDESTYKLGSKLEQTIFSVLEKMGVENEVESVSITADVYVSIKVKDLDVPQYIMTDREIMGQREIFTVIPEFDLSGNLVGMDDNEDETFEAVAKALESELPSEEIESAYADEDLTEFGKEQGGDICEVAYNHKDGFVVVRYYREGIGLVAEVSAEEKPEEPSVD